MTNFDDVFNSVAGQQPNPPTPQPAAPAPTGGAASFDDVFNEVAGGVSLQESVAPPDVSGLDDTLDPIYESFNNTMGTGLSRQKDPRERMPTLEEQLAEIDARPLEEPPAPNAAQVGAVQMRAQDEFMSHLAALPMNRGKTRSQIAEEYDKTQSPQSIAESRAKEEWRAENRKKERADRLFTLAQQASQLQAQHKGGVKLPVASPEQVIKQEKMTPEEADEFRRNYEYFLKLNKGEAAGQYKAEINDPWAQEGIRAAIDKLPNNNIVRSGMLGLADSVAGAANVAMRGGALSAEALSKLGLAPESHATMFGEAADQAARVRGRVSEENLAKVRETGGNQFAAETAFSIGNSLGMLALGGAGTTQMALQTGARTATENYTEAKDRGLASKDAAAYGVITGAVDAIVTALFEKMGRGGVESSLTKEEMRALVAPTVRQLAERALIKTPLDEGAEEAVIAAVNEVVPVALEQITGNKDFEQMQSADIAEALKNIGKAGAMGAASGAAFGGATSLPRTGEAIANSGIERARQLGEARRAAELAKQNVRTDFGEGKPGRLPEQTGTQELQEQVSDAVAFVKSLPREAKELLKDLPVLSRSALARLGYKGPPTSAAQRQQMLEAVQDEPTQQEQAPAPATGGIPGLSSEPKESAGSPPKTNTIGGVRNTVEARYYPSLPDGNKTIRLYHGHTGGGGKNANSGTQWTTDQNYARNYGGGGKQVDYVDIKVDELPSSWLTADGNISTLGSLPKEITTRAQPEQSQAQTPPQTAPEAPISQPEAQPEAPQEQAAAEPAPKPIPEENETDPETGKDRVFYHGTQGDFDIENSILNEGGVMYVALRPEDANLYAKRGGWDAPKGAKSGANIQPLKMAKSNLLDPRTEAGARALFDIRMSLEGNQNAKLLDTNENGLVYWEASHHKDLMDAVKKAGFDGIYLDEEGHTSIALFDPKRLRSALTSKKGANPNKGKAAPAAETPKVTPETPKVTPETPKVTEPVAKKGAAKAKPAQSIESMSDADLAKKGLQRVKTAPITSGKNIGDMNAAEYDAADNRSRLLSEHANRQKNPEVLDKVVSEIEASYDSLPRSSNLLHDVLSNPNLSDTAFERALKLAESKRDAEVGFNGNDAETYRKLRAERKADQEKQQAQPSKPAEQDSKPEELPAYSVFETSIGGQQRWAVVTKNSQGKKQGHELFRSESEARAEAEQQKARDNAPKKGAAVKEVAPLASEKVTGYANTLPPMQRAKATAALSGLVRHEGVVMKRHELAEKMAAEGYALRDHPKHGLEYFKGDSFVPVDTKTEAAYFRHITQSESQPTTDASRSPEEGRAESRVPDSDNSIVDRIAPYDIGDDLPLKKPTGRFSKRAGTVSKAEVAERLRRIFDTPVLFGKLKGSKKIRGFIETVNNIIRAREGGELQTLTHEIAHSIDLSNGYTERPAGRFYISESAPPEVKAEWKKNKLDYDPKLTRPHEAFAEFVRAYLTTDDAQRVAPLTYDWFQGVLKKNPGLSKMMADAKEHVDMYREQTDRERVAGSIKSSGTSLGPSSRDVVESVQTEVADAASAVSEFWKDAILDKNSVFGEMQKHHEEMGGTETKEDIRHLAEATMKTYVAAAQEMLMNGIRKVTQSQAVIGPAILKELESLKLSEQERVEADQYAKAVSTLELLKRNEAAEARRIEALERMAERQNEQGYAENAAPKPMPKYISDITPEQARKRVAELKSPKFDAYVALLKKANDSMIDMLVDAGVMGKNEGQAIKESREFYVPMTRVMPKGIGRVTNAVKGVFRTKSGSTLPTYSPIQQTVARLYHLTRVAMNAELRREIVKRAYRPVRGEDGTWKWVQSASDMGRYIVQVEPEMEMLDVPLKDKDGELTKQAGEQLARMLKKAGIEPAVLDGLPPEAKLRIAREMGARGDDDGRITLVNPDGSRSTFKITNERLARALRGERPLEAWSTAWLLEKVADVLIGVPAQALKLSATALSVGFAPYNFTSDLPFFALNRKEASVPIKGLSSAAKDTAYIVKPMQEMAHYLLRAMFGKRAYNAVTGAVSKISRGKIGANRLKLYDLYEGGGGPITAAYGTDMADIDTMISDVLKNSAKRRLLKLLTPSGFADTLSHILGTFESPFRLTEVIAAYEKQGWPLERIQKERPPRHVTLRALDAGAEVTGNWRRAGSLSGYLNRYIPFFNPSVRVTEKAISSFRENKLQFVARGLAYITAPTVAYWLAKHDDDEYEEQPTWLKYGTFTFKDEEGRVAYRLVRERGLAGYVFSVMPQVALDRLYKEDPKAAKSLAEEFIKRVVPPMPWNTPTVDASIAAMTGYDTFKKQQIENQYDQSVLPTDRTDDKTSLSAKNLSQMLYDEESKSGPSPKMIDAVLNKLSGGAYGTISDMGEGVFAELDTVIKKLGGDFRFVDSDRKAGQPFMDPAVRRFRVERDYTTSINEFYEASQKAAQQRGSEIRNRSLTDETDAEYRRTNALKNLIAEIRKSVPPDEKDRDKRDKATAWMTGVARMALGKPPLEKFKIPIQEEEYPEVEKAMKSYIGSLSNNLMREKPVKLSDAQRGKTSLVEEVQQYEREKAEALKQLKALGMTPEQIMEYAGEQVSKYKGSTAYRKLMKLQEELGIKGD